MKSRKRIGVFVCWCGSNIAEVVDVDHVVEAIKKYPGVVHAENYVYMCSDPGQKLVQDAIVEKKLDSVIVACCSPTLHETTFRNVCRANNLNPYQCEIANIREQCSWVHKDDKETATLKAVTIIKTILEKINQNESLEPISIPVTRRALVIGAGIAGIQASLDIANAGYEVILVEKNPSIGGHMIQLSETFPTLDCSQCILTPKMVEVALHPKIKLMAYSEVQEISGYVGNFTARILKKPRYVIEDKCTLCMKCEEVCPIAIAAEFEGNLAARKAIYLPFPQAIPATYTIDIEHCPGFLPIACGKCAEVCEPNAIDFDMKPEIIEEQVGSVVVATGFELYPLEDIPEYGGGKILDVIDGLQMERLLSAAGPTNGVVKRPSDGKIPQSIAFVHCVRSRDPEHGMAYCSRLCCMYMVKQAMLYKHTVHGAEAYSFYIDLRTNGKGYEEFYNRTREEDWVHFIRGKPAKIVQNGDKVQVWGTNTLTGQQIKLDVDMVVLAQAMVPTPSGLELLKRLRLATDEYGWIKEQHLKLRPLESMMGGVMIAGVVQYPKDITDTVAHASGAASKVLDMFSQPELHRSPTIAHVDPNICAGCGYCEANCAYKAIEVDPFLKVAIVNGALCEGCGTCAMVCPSGAAQHINFFKAQVQSMVHEATRDYQ